MNKITNYVTIIVMLSVITLVPLGTQAFAQTTSLTGTLSIASTCGLAVTSGGIVFGSVSVDTAGAGNSSLELTNSGSATASITVSAEDWKDTGGVVHLQSEQTKFAPTNIGSDTYATKTSMNSTNGAIPFGVINPGTNAGVNATFWGIATTDMTNLPFSGDLTQSVTLFATCL